MKKRGKCVVRTTISVFGLFGLGVAVQMLCEPYYFDQFKESYERAYDRIVNRNFTNPKEFFETVNADIPHLTLTQEPQSIPVKNLKKEDPSSSRSVRRFIIDLSGENNLDQHPILIQNTIQTWSLSLWGYYPDFSSVFSPDFVSYLAEISFEATSSPKCFIITNTPPKQVSNCSPLAISRGVDKNSYLKSLSLELYSENDAQLQISRL